MLVIDRVAFTIKQRGIYTERIRPPVYGRKLRDGLRGYHLSFHLRVRTGALKLYETAYNLSRNDQILSQKVTALHSDNVSYTILGNAVMCIDAIMKPRHQ